MKNNFIKAITLTSFALLLGLFVTYRSGFFGPKSEAVAMSPNGSVITSASKDSTQVKDSIKPQTTIISSSKSIIVRDFNIKDDPSQKDSMIDYFKRKGIIFSGSKSGPVIKYEDIAKIVRDTVTVDTLKNKNDD